MSQVHEHPAPNEGACVFTGWLLAIIVSALLWVGLVWVGRLVWNYVNPKEVPSVRSDTCNGAPGWARWEQGVLPRGLRGLR